MYDDDCDRVRNLISCLVVGAGECSGAVVFSHCSCSSFEKKQPVVTNPAHNDAPEGKTRVGLCLLLVEPAVRAPNAGCESSMMAEAAATAAVSWRRERVLLCVWCVSGDR